MNKTVTIVGAGYVGLAVSIVFSENNNIILFDVDKTKVDKLKSGKLPIRDKEMCKFFAKVKDNRYFTITSEQKGVFKNSDYIIIAVPTNWNEVNHSLDIDIICEVLEQIQRDNINAIIIIKSTLPLGTMDYLEQHYRNLSIIYVPEFLREGSAVKDEKNMSRLIIGSNKSNYKYISEVKRLFLESQSHDNIPVIVTSGKEAELIKLYANAYLALRVNFFNEIDTYAEIENLNSQKIIEGVSLDSRIGNYYNVPSFGYGGYCLPKDTKELVHIYNNVPSIIIPSLIQANKLRKKYITESIIKRVDSLNIDNPLIGIYRINMKRNSDNFREAAILDIIEALMKDGYEIIVFEPLRGNSESFPFDFIDDLSQFKNCSTIIVANRMSSELMDVQEKVYTRDWF